MSDARQQVALLRKVRAHAAQNRAHVSPSAPGGARFRFGVIRQQGTRSGWARRTRTELNHHFMHVCSEALQLARGADGNAPNQIAIVHRNEDDRLTHERRGHMNMVAATSDCGWARSAGPQQLGALSGDEERRRAKWNGEHVDARKVCPRPSAPCCWFINPDTQQGKRRELSFNQREATF